MFLNQTQEFIQSNSYQREEDSVWNVGKRIFVFYVFTPLFKFTFHMGIEVKPPHRISDVGIA